MREEADRRIDVKVLEKIVVKSVADLKRRLK